jgi:carotenoid 1,2-hydratase
VFSPYYAWARRRGAPDPANHCALNVVLYGAGGKRWCVTERGRAAVTRDAARFAVGPSRLTWDGAALTVEVDEITSPLPMRVQGRITVHAPTLTDRAFTLDPAGHHGWWPAAPVARVEVDMERPRRRWQGAGYLDANWGDEPLEAGFRRWDWSRAALPDGRAAVLYDVAPRNGDGPTLALLFDGRGGVEELAAPPPAALPATRVWRIPRGTRAEDGRAQVVETLEDTPFYARSVVASRLLGQPVTAVHESLSLTRFAQPWVQMLLPFRMPRALRDRRPSL